MKFCSYCDFKHLSDVLTNLLTVDPQSWGEMVSRVVGVLISDYSKTVDAINTGLETGDFTAAGTSFGTIFS
jgi:hypothetical protein